MFLPYQTDARTLRPPVSNSLTGFGCSAKHGSCMPSAAGAVLIKSTHDRISFPCDVPFRACCGHAIRSEIPQDGRGRAMVRSAFDKPFPKFSKPAGACSGRLA